MNNVFLWRKKQRNTAIVCLALSLGMMVVSVFLAMNESRIPLAIVFGVFWGFWVGVGVWMLFAYWRESLCIRDGIVIKRGVLRTKSVVLSQLVGLAWRIPGTIVLCSERQKINVYFANFEPEERQRLIRLLRHSTPCSIQQGWDRFCYLVAIPLLRRSGEHSLREDEFLFTRWRIDRIFISLIPLAAAIGVGFAWYLQEARCLLAPVPLAIPWLCIRAATPAQGIVLLNRNKLDNRFFFGMLMWSVAGVIGAGLLDTFKHHLSCPSWWMWSWTLFWFCVLLVLSHRADKRKWQSQRKEIELAVQEWELHEANEEAL